MKKISQLLTDFGDKTISEDEIHILPCGINYGKNAIEVDEMISDLNKSDGIILDPIYNAKSFLTMKYYLEEKQSFKNVLYINTGGSPNLFY